jgi:GntR family transcriptional regulator of vanillate catabolism
MRDSETEEVLLESNDTKERVRDREHPFANAGILPLVLAMGNRLNQVVSSGAEQSRISQTLRAVLGLRELILNGEIEVGKRVSELSLVARIGVSRTPLRLALTQLENEGLLERQRNGGFVVREFTESDIYEAIDLRGVLEGTAARLAAERLTDAGSLASIAQCLKDLEEVVRETETTLDLFAEYAMLNERFHSQLVALAGNRMLEQTIKRVQALPFVSPSAFVFREANFQETRGNLFIAQEQHSAILEAIRQREGTRAEALTREHARIGRRKLWHILRHEQLLKHVPGASLIKIR